jgi:hypothetical protein
MHIHDTVHLALMIHLFSNLNVTDELSSGRAAGGDDAGSLLTVTPGQSRPSFHLFTLLHGYITTTLAGDVIAAVELVALVHDPGIRRALLVVRAGVPV